MFVFLLVLAAILLLLIVSGGYTFMVACLRIQELLWLDEEALKKTPYGRFYDHIVSGNDWLVQHNAQEVHIRNEDNLELWGLWVPAENPRGTILLAHGYRSSFLPDFGLVFDFYHKQGMNLLLPNQRSHGKSEGKYITYGVKESRDMLCWIDFHNRTFGEYPMILSGLSMGASTVMYMVDLPLPENVRGLIVDCGFTSPKEIISKVFRETIHLPAGPSMWVADLFARVFAGFSFSEKDARKILQKNYLPILMVHGTADDFVPCDMTREAYAHCAGPKQLLLVEGAGHGVSFLHAREDYTEAVKELLNQCIG